MLKDTFCWFSRDYKFTSQLLLSEACLMYIYTMFGWRDLVGNDFLCLDNNFGKEGFRRKGNGGTNVPNFIDNHIFPRGQDDKMWLKLQKQDYKSLLA